jgi:hypothetical protein
MIQEGKKAGFDAVGICEFYVITANLLMHHQLKELKNYGDAYVNQSPIF